MLENAKIPNNYKGPQVDIVTRNLKEPNDKQLNNFFEHYLRKNVGILLREPGIGNLFDEWNSALSVHQHNVNLIDCSGLIDSVFALKDNNEIEKITVAAKYGIHVLNSMIKKFENTIDEDNKITHQKISNDIKLVTDKPLFLTKFKEKFKFSNIEETLLELPFPPIIESGEEFHLNFDVPSNNKYLHSSIIICRTGTKYKDYNARLSRTFMIDADKVYLAIIKKQNSLSKIRTKYY